MRLRLYIIIISLPLFYSLLPRKNLPVHIINFAVALWPRDIIVSAAERNSWYNYPVRIVSKRLSARKHSLFNFFPFYFLFLSDSTYVGAALALINVIRDFRLDHSVPSTFFYKPYSIVTAWKPRRTYIEK